MSHRNHCSEVVAHILIRVTDLFVPLAKWVALYYTTVTLPVRYLVLMTAGSVIAQFDKFHVGAFGRCPRVYCQGQSVLPAGLSDVPRNCTVAVYCPKCQVCRIIIPFRLGCLKRDGSTVPA